MSSLNVKIEPQQKTTPFIPIDEAEFESSIPARFEAQVEKYPDNIAIKEETGSLTYSEYNAKANQLAHAILAHNGGSDTPVVVLAGYGSPALIAIMGVLKAGRPFVIIDPTNPEDRINEILIESNSNLIVTDNENYELSALLVNSKDEKIENRIVNIDKVDSNLSTQNLGREVSPDTHAYIFYTSGSTGKPKGVVNNHRNILHSFLNYAITNKVTPDDKFLLGTAMSFAASTGSIFGALLNGASVLPFPLKSRSFSQLKHWLIQEEITVCFFVPSSFRHFAQALSGKEDFPNLRMIALGGEAIYKHDVDLYKNHFTDDCILRISLASTDAGGICYDFIDKSTEITSDVVPVGRPIKGVEVLLLDDDLKPAGPNEIGEIVVQSRYLPLGYWRRPDLNKGKYLPDPEGGDKRICLTGDLGRFLPDGRLEHISRKDTMVKIRGLRIEITEIEAHLLAIDTINDAVIVARDDRFGEKRLVAYVIPSSDNQPSIIDLRESVAEKLPDYMVPSTFVFLDSLPKTTSGKINRLALPEPPKGRLISGQEYVAPSNDMEARLVQIFEKYLGIQPVGIKDDFLEIGGHSLVAIQIITEIEDTLNITITINDFVNALSVEKLADNLQSLGAKPASRYLVILQPNGKKIPFFCIPPAGVTALPFKNLSNYMGEERPFIAIEYAGMYGETEPQKTIEGIASFNIEIMKSIQPEGPYYVAGMCFGSIVALEMAHQIINSGEKVAFIGVLDSRNLPAQKMRLIARIIKLIVDISKKVFNGKFSLKIKGDHQRMEQEGLDSSVLPHVAKVFETHAYAHLIYTAPPIPAVITLFMTEWDKQDFMKRQWQNASNKELDLVIVPGIHLPLHASEDMEPTFLSETNVQEVAKLLNDSLDKAGEQYKK